MGTTTCIATTLGGKGVDEFFSNYHVVELINAAEALDNGKVRTLIDSGININEVGLNGFTPLLWLMLSNNYDGISLLLQNGADPNLVTWDDNSALTLAVGGSEINLKTLKLLLDAGGDPNAIGSKGDTALIIAIKRRRWEHMLLLIKYGADLNKHDLYNTTTPVMMAASEGQYEQVYHMLEMGADHASANKYGYTLSHRLNLPVGDASPWKKKVKTWLENKGIIFPVPKPKKTKRDGGIKF